MNASTTALPYDETKWAELVDYTLPIAPSLSLLETLQKRWAHLLRSLTPNNLEKAFIHSDSGEVSVRKNIGIYSWYDRHHFAHINYRVIVTDNYFKFIIKIIKFYFIILWCCCQ
ncbi:MAG: DinB family protein [Solibacillus sp.]